MEIRNKTLEAFKEQRAKHLKAMSEYSRRVTQAEEEYNALKAKYEGVIRESVQSGEDKTKELDQLSDQIEKAEKTCHRRRSERGAFNALQIDADITHSDVAEAFNSDVTPEFRKQRFDAVLDRLLKAKIEYAESVVDYYTAIKEFEEMRDDVLDVVGDNYRYKLAQVKLSNTDTQGRYFLTNADMYELNYGNMPASVKQAKGVK